MNIQCGGHPEPDLVRAQVEEVLGDRHGLPHIHQVAGLTMTDLPQHKEGTAKREWSASFTNYHTYKCCFASI